MNPRVIIVKTLLNVFRDNHALNFDSIKHDEKPFIKQCCFGVCRFFWKLDFIAAELLSKPLKEKDEDIQILLLVGIYQILFLNIADHAAVSETVNAAKKLKKPWATKLINACLRKFIREKETILASMEKDEEAKYSHPQWMIDKIKKSWVSEWENILEANNAQAPMTLRINQSKISRDDYQQKHFPNITTKQPASSLQLQTAQSVGTLPGFQEGHVSVQDAASQCVAPLLNLKPEMKILDACSAPGGKACHLLEICSDINLTALDIDERRLTKVQENLNRLQLKANLITGDASQTNWWDGKLFDAILLDAPCTASGVIRRHPDSKWLRIEEDVDQLASLQEMILENLWPLLKPGGQLLYTTCSIFPEENSDNIAKFLTQHPDAKEAQISLPFGKKAEHGWQVLPEINAQDGFYYCLLKRGQVVI